MTYGMLIDLKKCVGCHACSVACKEAHGTRPGVRRSRVDRVFEGTYPDVRKTAYPRTATSAPSSASTRRSCTRPCRP